MISLKLDNNNLSNQKLNDILQGCTNLKYLSLRNLKNLTSIDFIKNLTNLKVLDLYGCSNLNDLSILEELRNTNKQSVRTLRIDNEKIDLTKIQNVISNLTYLNVIGKYDLDCTWNGAHGFYATYNVWKNLENCTEITNLEGTYCNDRYVFDSYVDLTKCTKLKSIDLSYINVKLKIPDNVTNIKVAIDSIQSDMVFTENSELKEINILKSELKWTNKDFANWCNRLSVCQKLSAINFTDNWYEDGSRSILSKLENINLLKNCSSLRTLSISALRNLTDITGIGELTQLTTLSLYNCTSLVDISDLAVKYENEVQKGLTNLTYLNLSNNSINDISCLKDYKNLQELNLNKNRISNIYYLKDLSKLSKLSIQNNCIYDNDYYSDENGNNKTFNSTEILLNLYNQALRYIYIDNNYIVDFSKISKLKWNEHTGF